LTKPGLGASETQKYITHLEILSNLRKLQYLVAEKISSMSIHYDIKKDLRYMQGKREGVWEEKLNLAKQAIKEGLEIALIMRLTGLSESEIERLRKG
jgi:predicted transposase YdaD